MKCSWCGVLFVDKSSISRKINDEEYCLDCLVKLAIVGKETLDRRAKLFHEAMRSMRSNQA